jgi:hypothetical protein
VGEVRGKVAQTMYTHVSKCKNDKKGWGKNGTDKTALVSSEESV